MLGNHGGLGGPWGSDGEEQDVGHNLHQSGTSLNEKREKGHGWKYK